MELTSNTHNNEDTEEDTDTDDESTANTATDDEDNNEPDDGSTTCHQPPMQPYGMNVNLHISYIAILEQFDIFKV
eukprot:12556194-Ditylum_brightwellii.AAC.1